MTWLTARNVAIVTRIIATLNFQKKIENFLKNHEFYFENFYIPGY